MSIFNGIFKKKRSDIYNIYHPEVAPNIKEAFKSGGVQYYTFIDYSSFMSYRYQMAAVFQRQHLQHISRDKALEYIEKIEGFIGNPQDGALQLGKALKTLELLKQRFQIEIEPDTLWRLASCCYFDDKEVLTEYDSTINDAKIESWKKEKGYDFFFTQPMNELVNYKDISPEGLKIYLEAAQEEVDLLDKTLTTL